jgi:hypothetical protein
MSSKTWKKYYDRPPFLEGCVSAFDLFGENTSFNFDTLNTSLPPTMRTKLRISSAFSRVGKYLSRSMGDYVQK